jgi:very-short-patch-repair endonuclease
MIADCLCQNSIRYEYERQVGYYFPDFYLSDYDIIVEFWGSEEYEDNGIRSK